MLPPLPAGPDEIAEGLALRLGARLSEVGFTDEAVRERLGLEHLFPLGPGNLPLNAFGLREDGPLEAAVLLFALGLPLSLKALRGLIPGEDDWADLEVAGFYRIDEAERLVRPLFAVWPFGGRLVAFDRIPAPEDDPLGDSTGERVFPPGLHDLFLEALSPRRAVARTLCLGAQAGAHALTTAIHSQRVVAVEPSPRAQAFLRWNAAMNAAPNVEVLPAPPPPPAPGEGFDLVLAVLPSCPRLVGRSVAGAAASEQELRAGLAEAARQLEAWGEARIACFLPAPDLGRDWQREILAGLDGASLSVTRLFAPPVDAQDLLYGHGLYAYLEGGASALQAKVLETQLRSGVAPPRVSLNLFTLAPAAAFEYRARALAPFLAPPA